MTCLRHEYSEGDKLSHYDPVYYDFEIRSELESLMASVSEVWQQAEMAFMCKLTRRSGIGTSDLFVVVRVIRLKPDVHQKILLQPSDSVCQLTAVWCMLHFVALGKLVDAVNFHLSELFRLREIGHPVVNLI